MRERLQFIDLHRAIVILVMIEVHVFNAFMQTALRQTGWFHTLNFINGLVAPSFLFISGFIFVFTTEKKMDEYRKFSGVFWKQLGRLLAIWIIGYSVRWNLFSLHEMVAYFQAEQWADFFKVDVLQTIAVGLLVLFALRLLKISTPRLKWTLAALTVLVGVLSPFMYMINFHGFLPWGVANYFNNTGGSLFPLFPWLAFLFAGGVVATLFQKVKGDAALTKKFFTRFLIAGVAMIILGHLLFTGNSPIYIWVPQPNIFFLMARIGYVSVIFYLCWLVCLKVDFSKSAVLDLSKASLLAYWLHLMIIYKYLWANRGLSDIIKNSLNQYECILATILMILVVQDVAIVWNRLKENRPKLGMYIGRGVVFLPLAYFLFRW